MTDLLKGGQKFMQSSCSVRLIQVSNNRCPLNTGTFTLNVGKEIDKAENRTFPSVRLISVRFSNLNAGLIVTVCFSLYQIPIFVC